jgi:hypothetical protein
VSTRQEIIDSCAWILWAQGWISLQEELPDGVNPGAGGSWDPYVPEVPANVKEGAEKLIAAIERMNDAPIDRLYERAIALPGKRYTKREPTPDRFGTCLGYQATGAGVSWADDYPDPGIKVPNIEVHVDSDTTAYVGDVDERFA